MFFHSTFSLNSFLAFSCLWQSSRKYFTISILCPHVQCGSSVMLNQCRYWLSPQCPMCSCVSVALCLYMRELCTNYVLVCTFSIYRSWHCLLVAFSKFQKSIVFLMISAFIVIIYDDFSLYTLWGVLPVAFPLLLISLPHLPCRCLLYPYVLIVKNGTTGCQW